MAYQLKKKLKKEQNRTYTARDFESLRSQLLETARTYFPDKIQDFSEPSVGGMFLDFVASVGDSLSYYLDHSFRELDPFRASEPENIITHLDNAGVEIVGAAPAVVLIKFQLTVPAEKINDIYYPKRSAMPVVLAGTQISSESGIPFTTINDIDFAEKDIDNKFLAKFTISSTDSNGAPSSFHVTQEVYAVSGQIKTETIAVSDGFIPFREIELQEKNITAILSVSDTELNKYFETSSLSEDTAFEKVKNNSADASQVPYFIRVVAAPYRFVRAYSPVTQTTTIRFGSGDASSLDDDIVPDPSDLALNLYGKTTVPRFSINPENLLKTQTLGISPRGTTLNISYRYGGGLSHNVSEGQIELVDFISLSFRRSPSAADALSVRQSVSVTNLEPAAGGDSAPTLQDLQLRITGARKSQRRVVSREDLLARIYSLPSEFGRVYRAALSDNPVNPMSAILYILSRNQSGSLSVSPDSLKKNIQTYLNELRLIGDSVDILDAKVVNYGVKYSIYVSENANKTQVITDVNSRISSILGRQFFNIDQPIIVDNITNMIINTNFVVSLIDLQIFPRAGLIEDRTYATSGFSFKESSKKGIIMPGRGSIFELKYPDFDIIGTAY